MQLSQPIYRLKHRARLLSRQEGIPLHIALDRIAREEGFASWCLLAHRAAGHAPRNAILSRLAQGDLLLLAGRPGQGKTLLSLELAVEAMKAGRSAFFFTLEYTRARVLRCIAELGEDPRSFGSRLRVDTSDDISGGYVVKRLASAARDTVVVVDYLQLLDQKRGNPDLPEQVTTLRAFARERGLVVVCLSQIDRRFDDAGRRMPGLADIRLPNPLDLDLFTGVCFVHAGSLAFFSNP